MKNEEVNRVTLHNIPPTLRQVTLTELSGSHLQKDMSAGAILIDKDFNRRRE